MKINYRTNNSCGSWWLKDKDWLALDKAGWYVYWSNIMYCNPEWNFLELPERFPICSKLETCRGHRAYETFEEALEHRWLGAVACKAMKEFSSIEDAIKEFEEITGESLSDNGCECCGPPHCFEIGECHFTDCGCDGPHKDMEFISGRDFDAYN